MSEFTIVITIIFAFTFIPLILAEIARNQSLPSIEDFFLCSRKMSAPLYFFTIYSTWYSTFAVMGSTSHFYFNGPVYMTAFAWNTLFAISLFFVGRRLWFYGKNHSYITPPDFFKDIYQSKPLTLLVTVILLIFTLPYIQIQFSGGAYLIEVASDGKIPWYLAGFIFYTIMIVYLWAGGLRAVALTDVFFGILIFITLLGTGFLLASKVGHTDDIFSKLMTDDINSVTLSGKAPNSVYMWLAMFIITPLGAVMSPPVWIRNYSVKNEKTFYLVPFLITIAAAGYIGCLIAGNAGKILEPNLTDPDTLIPTLLTKYCGQVLMTLLFCGFAAASLSTANSQIHALSAIYTIDIHKEYINKNANDTKLLYVGKWAVLAFSVIIYIIMISNPSFIINTGLLALSGTAQILVPVLGALFWKRSTSAGAFAGLLAGILTIWFLYFTFHLESSYCGVIGITINALLFIAVSKTTKQNPVTRAKIVDYYLEFESHH